MITLMYSNYAPSEGHVVRLESLVGIGKVHVAGDEAAALTHAGDVRIVLGHRYLRQLLPHAPRLVWVQSSAAGFDQLPWRELAARGILLSRNPHGAPAIGHHVVALAWSLLRRLPMAYEAQQAGCWHPPFAMLPLPRTALILGLGAIGLATAKLLRGLGLRVLGVATQGTAVQRLACDEFLMPDEWRSRLPEVDVLVLTLPLDDGTRACVASSELSALPGHAVVVNVSRAAVLDQDALLRALEDGQIGGAALDVLDPIPTPESSVWRTPNLLITPKVASYHPGMQQVFESFAEAQVARYLAGEEVEARVALPMVGHD